MHHSLEDLHRALSEEPAPGEIGTGITARLDTRRENRKGIPEVVFAEGKQVEHSIQIIRRFLQATGRAIVSRAQPELIQSLTSEFVDYNVQLYKASRMVVLRRPDHVRPTTGGLVGIVTAGTSDIPTAEEAAVIAMEMGCAVRTIYDVGVAGLHRLIAPLQNLLAAGVDVLIVAAGMDGALPSVVSGLVDVPVIGLPTPIGYGMGGKGVAALMTMLQTCSPGLAVVNIDNGIGAGSTAALIANRMAAARGRTAFVITDKADTKDGADGSGTDLTGQDHLSGR